MHHWILSFSIMVFILFSGSVLAQPADNSARRSDGIERIKVAPGREIKIAVAWGDRLQPPSRYPRSIINLRDAMMKWTEIPVSIESQVRLGSPDIHKLSILFISAGDQFDLTETEKRNVREYIENGGFVFADGVLHSAAGVSVRQLVRDVTGNKRMELIPSDHPIFQVPFQLDGPPRGSEADGQVINETSGARVLTEEAVGIQGVFINGRLAAVYSPKGYYARWNDGSSVTQLKFGVNLIMYAVGR